MVLANRSGKKMKTKLNVQRKKRNWQSFKRLVFPSLILKIMRHSLYLMESQKYPPMRALTNNERIGVMARLGLLLLRKNYNRSSDASVVALALDPHYGFQYLERSSWSESVTSYVEPAIKDVVRIFNMITSSHNEASVTSTTSNKIQKISQTVSVSSKHSKLSFSKHKHNYDTYISSNSDSDEDKTQPKKLPDLSELDKFKKMEALPSESDPLQWWFKRQSMYPILSNMFLDHATIPATLITPEQLFSSMGLLCASSQNRMKHGHGTLILIIVKYSLARVSLSLQSCHLLPWSQANKQFGRKN
jgi:hAT family C-terminal dimerisation region